MDYEAKARRRAELVWSDIVLNSMNAEQATDAIAAAIREAVEGREMQALDFIANYPAWNGEARFRLGEMADAYRARALSAGKEQPPA